MPELPATYRGDMTSIEALLPPPNVAATVVLELAAADQPRSGAEGVDLLRSIGVASGGLRPTDEPASRLVVEAAGSWRTTDSGLMLAPDGAVVHVWSHVWHHNAPDAVMVGFQSLVDAVNSEIGAPGDEERRGSDSRSASWIRPSAHIEAYLFPQGPNTRAGVQIGVSWAVTPHDVRPEYSRGQAAIDDQPAPPLRS